MGLDFQRSYPNLIVLFRLRVNVGSLSPYKCDIGTLVDEQTRSVKQIALEFEVFPWSKLFMPFLINSNLRLDFSFKDSFTAIKNFKNNGYALADKSFKNNLNNNTSNNIEDLIVVNVLQFLKSFSFINCINGSTIQFPHGIIHFKDVCRYLSLSEILQINTKSNLDDNLQIFHIHLFLRLNNYRFL